MKGLILGQYYATVKALIIYLIIAVLITLLMAFSGGESSGLLSLLIVMFAISAGTDNLKNEASAEWYKYAVTLPVSRKQIVQSHYGYYLITMLIGVGITLIGLVAGSLLGNLEMTNVIEAFGISFSIGLLMTLLYPFTYSVGADKSNMIQIIVGVIVLFIFFVFNFISLIIGGTIYESGEDAMQHIEFELIRQAIFIIISLVVTAAGYFIGLNKFKKTNF